MYNISTLKIDGLGGLHIDTYSMCIKKWQGVCAMLLSISTFCLAFLLQKSEHDLSTLWGWEHIIAEFLLMRILQQC